ncbi:MAG TPA: NAD-dependent epimerase/dehydratase family protein [Bacteroidales bacterium]|nr:NAD-dependent epimerase/dehydratase family protein [Bacteroidales bacterium]
MLRVGITGQAGFIGTHLHNFLNLKKDEVSTVPFQDSYFKDTEKLKEFVSGCDVIVHLAAMNRHGDPQVIYDTNIKLINQLLSSLDATGSRPHILFSSSTQEDRDNMYGKSKHDGRLMLKQWAVKNNSRFTGFVIPNVFGPFGNPYYNSVIATFCHQLTHNERPEIMVDANMQLIFVGELVQLMFQKMTEKNFDTDESEYKVDYTWESKVSDILAKLEYFKTEYFDNHFFPELNNKFEVNLFNTFRSYMDHAATYPVRLKKNTDDRGVFTETIKTSMGGQFSFSTTVPGITRGNHFHTRKIERFIVIKGEAIIELRRIGTDEVLSFELNGDEPSFVDMPVWYTHNIKNTGDGELITLFWINEFYNPDDPDTFYENV